MKKTFYEIIYSLSEEDRQTVADKIDELQDMAYDSGLAHGGEWY